MTNNSNQRGALNSVTGGTPPGGRPKLPVLLGTAANIASDGLAAIQSEANERLPLRDRFVWLDDLSGGLIVGGAYLLSGAPGGGKSRLATQLALDLGAQQIRSLVILTEEAPQRLWDRATAMTSDWRPAEAKTAMRHVEWTDEISDLEQLPAFFIREVLSPRGRFAGVKLIIIDSLQGDGVAANAFRKYARFYEFARAAKSAGITVVGVGHVNKRGQLAGPKGLEHFVDAVWRIEKVADFRIFAVTKNRFGPESPRGIPLLIDPITTALRPSPHITPVTGSAKTFTGSADEVELQASVSLPMPGSRPQITAPGLPRRRIEQLVGAITGVPMLGLSEFDLNIDCLLPGDTPFRSWLGLPLAIAMISSCIRRPVPTDALYLGEVDLNRNIRPLPDSIIGVLLGAIDDGLFNPKTRLFISPATAADLPSDMANLVPCATLDQAAAGSWPDLH